MAGELIRREYNGVTIWQRTDGYWNATAMCKANGREWSRYAETGRAKRFLEGLSRSLAENEGPDEGPLLIQILDGPNERRGTWVHRRVALHLAAWISDEFEQWVYERIEELLTKGHVSLVPSPEADADDPVLAMLAAATATRRLQMIHERRLTTVETKVRGIEAVQAEAVAVLDRCEPPPGPAPDKAMRARLNEYIRAYCRASGVPHQNAWNKLYKELYYRCHFDSLRRARNAGKMRLEVIEEAGLLPDLYAIACEVLVPPPADTGQSLP